MWHLSSPTPCHSKLRHCVCPFEEQNSSQVQSETYSAASAKFGNLQVYMSPLGPALAEIKKIALEGLCYTSNKISGDKFQQNQIQVIEMKTGP